jgi:hypothetical protein
LVHPSGYGDQYETKRIQHLQHCRSLIIASLALVPNYRQFKQFQFSVHTGVGGVIAVGSEVGSGERNSRREDPVEVQAMMRKLASSYLNVRGKPTARRFGRGSCRLLPFLS